ncbi:MAG: pilin [Elusimicrobiaceae bacterium]|nr:pilin [Elusimicrobiaceae bacterium]
MKMKKGFTLIELLVVVLIIGILSAVALPQYEIAVMKSRVSTGFALAKNIKNAEEIYYMANGSYTSDQADLDVDLPGGWTKKDWSHGNLYEWSNGMQVRINTIDGSVYVIPGGIKQEGGIEMYFDYPTDPVRAKLISCASWNSVRMQKVCKSMGGTLRDESGGGSNKHYRLPL